MSWFSRQAPLVKVRRPRPPNLVEVKTMQDFDRIVHEAESVEKNAGGRKTAKVVEVWIEVAGEATRARIELLGGLVTLRGPKTKNWERWACFYRGPRDRVQYPTIEDCEEAKREAGALYWRVFEQTHV